MSVGSSTTRFRTFLAATVLAVSTAACAPAAAPHPPLRTTPAYQPSLPSLALPPSFEDRLLYYNSFDGEDGKPQARSDSVEPRGELTIAADGFRGKGARTGKQGWLQLKSADFSPHLPLTVSFWWALVEDHKIDGGFGLIHLGGGRGMVSHFSRGKGGWCALERPAGILQVYYIPGIKNVNGIYDRDLMAHVDLRGGAWHHTAMVFRGASLVEVYTDGEKAWETRLVGRSFAASDKLHDLVIGTRGGAPMLLDEVVILRRALTPGDLRRYVRALRQMRAVGY
ncbi:MAG: hypothetical protein ISS72_03490 [Candidatus Brocadiae bacterium]|nr:hypothetical protein [Candidatus Brocadiia bacterium]